MHVIQGSICVACVGVAYRAVYVLLVWGGGIQGSICVMCGGWYSGQYMRCVCGGGIQGSICVAYVGVVYRVCVGGGKLYSH